MRLVITGGAGFVGSHLCDYCLDKGHEVVVIDNFISGSRDNLAHLAPDAKFQLLEQNISDGIQVDGAVDFIFHLASPASPVDYTELPIPTLKVGALGTHNALGLARAKNAGLLLASTSEVYGDPHVHPQHEEYWGNVNPVGPRACYDAQTEILTEAGWVAFPDLKPGVRVATLNTNGCVEYHHPDEHINEMYDGELLHFANAKLDFCVTPNHKLYVLNKTGLTKFLRADETRYWHGWRVPTGADFGGEEREFFELPAPPRNAKVRVEKVAMDTWLEFLGYYLSEGCTHIRKRTQTVGGRDYECFAYNILIAQQKIIGREKIAACLSQLGFRFFDSDHHQFRICSSQLAALLAPLGKSAQKYIPREFLKLSRRQSRILFDALMLGDGSAKGECFAYYSKSKQLADDVQELALRCGFAASVVAVKNREIYCVNMRPSRAANLMEPQSVPYRGRVYCVNVKNHVICVRRNGRAAWCGNCYDEAKRFAEALVMSYRRMHQLETRIIRIFNTYGPRMRLRDGRIVPNFLKQALLGEPLTIYGSGKQTRSFCYVSDLVEGIYAMMDCREYSPVNLGNPIEFTVLDFAELVKKMTGDTAPLQFLPLPQDDPQQRCPDISKARRLLGWEPKVPLEEGLQHTLKYFRAALQKRGELPVQPGD